MKEPHRFTAPCLLRCLLSVLALGFVACEGSGGPAPSHLPSSEARQGDGLLPGNSGGGGSLGGEPEPSRDVDAGGPALLRADAGSEAPLVETDADAGGISGSGDPEGPDASSGGTGGGDQPPPLMDPIWLRASRLRVVTTRSPSWVAWSELEVYAEAGHRIGDLQARAPASAADSPPRLAIDGDPNTAWNAGDFPPAELDVGWPLVESIGQVRIRVAQQPAGLTTHQLQLAGEDGRFETVWTWEGATHNGQWLVYRPEQPGSEPDPGDDPPDPEVGGGGVEGLDRGMAWVRSNPMFISGLTVRMAPPTPSQARAYFEDFGANAVHLWAAGLPHRMNGWLESSPPATRFVSWLQEDGRSADGGEIAGGFEPGAEGRIGYQIGDEPGSLEEFRHLEGALQALRARDPEALLIINFSFWPEDLDAILEHYASLNGDVVSFDTYTLGREAYGRMNIFREAGLSTGRPYWCYLNGYAEAGEERLAGPTAMRWTAFAHALFGYTGYTWFLYQIDPAHGLRSAFFQRTHDFDAPRTDRYAVAAQINRELANLGRALTQLRSTGVGYVPALSFAGLELPPGVPAWTPGVGGDPYLVAVETPSALQDLVVGLFEDSHGDHYVMVQNPNHQGGTFPTDSQDAAELQLRFDFSAAPDELQRDRVQAMNKQTGRIEELLLEPFEGQAAGLALSIEAGDVVFFKYATGRPFAQGP